MPKDPSSIVLVDTGKVVGGTPLRTTFHLFPYLDTHVYPRLLLERGAYTPSPAESRAPFHQDPTQRIVLLSLSDRAPYRPLGYIGQPRYSVFLVGPLLELLQSREGSEIRWDEWKKHVIFPSLDPTLQNYLNLWVSGCRLFYFDPVRGPPGARIMKMFDFSVQGRARHLSEEVDEGLGKVGYLSSTEAEGEVEWDPRLVNVHAGHDSIVFSSVSVTVAKPPILKNEAERDSSFHGSAVRG
jgi:hypothetical protein